MPSRYLNGKYPCNLIIQKPVAGGLIIAVFSFAFMIIYKPLGAQAARSFSFGLTMSLYSFFSGVAAMLGSYSLKRISWFRNDEDWTILKTIWLVNQKMQESSATGTDLLCQIPGIMVDMNKNISLEGSQNIIIMVDGKERERSFLSQLDASTIDKIEVTNNPGAGYDSGVTGVLNIILKKDRKAGINGYINAEIPSSSREIYLFPSYSISYGTGKLNLYTSWNGELAYFDIVERTDRSFRDMSGVTSIFSEQVVRQKNWSHRLHYGLTIS